MDGSSAQLSGQKRWTAVLFADLENFTTTAEAIGAEQTYALVGDIVRNGWKVIEEFGGHAVQYAGDSILAAFGAPIAVENASLNACLAGLKLQQEMDNKAVELRDRFGVAPRFRVGIAGGEVVVGEMDFDTRQGINLLGSAVNLASRIQNVAAAGEILCSEEISAEIEGFINTAPRGEHQLKGFKRKRQLFRVLNEVENLTTFDGRMRRGATGFYGREHEMSELLNWARMQNGEGVLEVVGQAGVGKSRLIHEAMERLTKDFKIIRGNCNLDLAKKPLSPILEILGGYVDQAKDDDFSEVLAKVISTFPDLEDRADRIATALSSASFEELGPNETLQLRRSVLLAFEAILNDRKTLVVLEDIHWLDSVSSIMITRLLDQSKKRLRFLVTRRDENYLDWLGHPLVRRLSLDQLSLSGMQGIVAGMLDVETVPQNLMSFIENSSEGNALFVEETVRYLRQEGKISVSEGQVIFDAGPEQMALSGNIQNLIFSRFDNLPPETKSVLRIAATRGRVFSEPFLLRCKPHAEGYGEQISQSSDAGLVEKAASGNPNEWQFSHALIGKAIADTALEVERQETHLLIANALEEESSSDRFKFAEELSFHFKRAGNRPKTIDYLHFAAQKAFSFYGLTQVNDLLAEAFGMIEEDPACVDDDQYATMLVLWTKALELSAQFRKMHEVAKKYYGRLRGRGQSIELAYCLNMWAMSRSHASEIERARSLVSEAIIVADAVGDEHTRVWCEVSKMRILLDGGFGGHNSIIEAFPKIEKYIDTTDDVHLMALARYILASAYRRKGEIRRSLKIMKSIEEYADQHDDLRAKAFTAFSCLMYWHVEEFDNMRRAADKALQYAIPGTADWRAATVSSLAHQLLTDIQNNDPDLFLEHMHRAEETDDRNLALATRFQRTLHLFRAGRIAEGWTSLKVLEEKCSQSGIAEIRDSINLMKGRIYLSLAGLIEPEGPRPKLGLKDIIRVLLMRVNAAKKAENAYQIYIERTGLDYGIGIANAQLGLGLVARARNDVKTADDYFQAAHENYAAEKMDARAAEALNYKSDWWEKSAVN